MKDLFTYSWTEGKDRYCVQGFNEPCFFAPCIDARQEDQPDIMCCFDCDFFKTCKTPCPAYRKKEE